MDDAPPWGRRVVSSAPGRARACGGVPVRVRRCRLLGLSSVREGRNLNASSEAADDASAYPVGMAQRRDPTVRDCRRALWLLGLQAPVTAAQVTAAYRSRVARTHPDRHAGSQSKEAAAATLTRALNEAR